MRENTLGFLFILVLGLIPELESLATWEAHRDLTTQLSGMQSTLPPGWRANVRNGVPISSYQNMHSQLSPITLNLYGSEMLPSRANLYPWAYTPLKNKP